MFLKLVTRIGYFYYVTLDFNFNFIIDSLIPSTSASACNSNSIRQFERDSPSPTLLLSSHHPFLILFFPTSRPTFHKAHTYIN